jgi:hypothetical protein
MSVLVVLHEATRTGAPRMGGLIAAALRKHLEVRVMCLNDGPLVGWLEERIGAENLAILDFPKLRHHTPFGERVKMAQAALAGEPRDMVYVGSVAASEFIVAAKLAGKTVVLNVYEKADSLRRLLEMDLAKMEILSLCDGVVLGASDELRHDLTEVFGFVPERCLGFGNVFDIGEIEAAAREGVVPAFNALGDPLEWQGRLKIGMCGHASPRKGSDIFFEVAEAVPEHDFVWIGNWDRDEAPENTVFDEFLTRRLPNLFVTGGVDNPYKYIGRLDLFFLSSREDPNPLVLTEALLLGVPILCFSGTTAVTDFLGRSAILCHGMTNTTDAVRVLRALDPAEIRLPEFRGLSEEHQRRFDIKQKIPSLLRYLASLRTSAGD